MKRLLEELDQLLTAAGILFIIGLFVLAAGNWESVLTYRY